MDQLHETIVLEIESARVTNVRAFIGWKTYEITDIRSVSLLEMHQNPASSKALLSISFLSLVIGALFCVGALSIPLIRIIQDISHMPRINAHLLFAVIGLLFIYLGSTGWDSGKPTYIVQIESTFGTSSAVKTKDKGYAERIINAIRAAMAVQRQVP
jgi:hypothetical protein